MRRKDYVLIILGTAVMAVSINSVFDPLGMVTGGFSGLAIVVKEMTGIPLGITMLILNIPLFLAAFKIKGFHFLKRSLAGMISLSFWLLALPGIPMVKEDMMLAAFCGGVLQGAGIGLTFMGHGTTGGSDMAAVLIQKKIPWYPVAKIMQAIDWVIVVIGALVFGFSMVLYSAVAIFIIAKVSDTIIEGLKFSKAAFIISEKHEAVTLAIMEELQRGMTKIPIRGGYSGKDKIMLFCVVPRKQIAFLKDIVHRIDGQAFVVVTDAREVLGEGFLQYE
ncbi:MAG: YitT family protein [Ruminococcus sp.]|jgi:uncharacterized membrane-anchored protein YitT (DUF2179 family)